MKSKPYIGGWKSVFYSFHVVNEVGLGQLSRTVLSKNTCKTCAYGMGGQKGGMVNEVGERIEICKKSLQAQLTDIQEPIPMDFWSQNALEALLKLRPRELEKLGRLQHPLFKKKGATHYKPISWKDSIELASKKFNDSDPNRTFFYSSGRSSNEAAFLLQLFARIYGTNNINNCSYYCHQATGVGMTNTLGTGTATIELADLKKADLIFVIGANPSSNHPRFLSELMHCRRRGGKVIVINPVKEAGMMRFSIPSDVRSFLSAGSDIASHYLQNKIGGDLAVLYGISKYLIEHDLLNEDFISNSTEGYLDFEARIRKLTWEEIEISSGLTKKQMVETAVCYANAEQVVFSWAMGITHHKNGVDNVEAIVNLAMLKGMVGKQNAGLLPLRGHSNVQGVGSVGFTPKLKQEIFDNIEKVHGIKLPKKKGWDTMECMDQALKGKVDMAFILGGNLYASNPDLKKADKALNNIPFKVFLNTTLNEGHLRGVDQDILIMPVLVRDEEKQATTQESMFNFLRMSDGGINRRQNLLSEIEIIVKIADRVVESQSFDFKSFLAHHSIRKVMAKLIPGFESLAEIDETKEEFQIKGRTLHSPKFKTKSGKAKFVVNNLPPENDDKKTFKLMSVRSEGQFNSIIYEEEDAWRGTKHRNVILMNPEDIKAFGFFKGQRATLNSKVGLLSNLEIHPFDIAKGCILGYYPETNVLVSSETDPRSKTPSFKNTEVWISLS